MCDRAVSSSPPLSDRSGKGMALAVGGRAAITWGARPFGQQPRGCRDVIAVVMGLQHRFEFQPACRSQRITAAPPPDPPPPPDARLAARNTLKLVAEHRNQATFHRHVHRHISGPARFRLGPSLKSRFCGVVPDDPPSLWPRGPCSRDSVRRLCCCRFWISATLL